jgi:hypothetical protein
MGITDRKQQPESASIHIHPRFHPLENRFCQRQCLSWIDLDTVPDFSVQILAPCLALGFPAGANSFYDIFARYLRVGFPHGFNHSPDGGFIKRSVHFCPFTSAAMLGFVVAVPYMNFHATAALKFRNLFGEVFAFDVAPGSSPHLRRRRHKSGGSNGGHSYEQVAAFVEKRCQHGQIAFRRAFGDMTVGVES